MSEEVLKFVVRFCKDPGYTEAKLKEHLESFFRNRHTELVPKKVEVSDVQCMESATLYVGNIYQLVVLVTYSDVKQNFNIDCNIAEICRKWCKIEDVSHWLIPVTNERFYFEENRFDAHMKTSQFAFGTLPEMGKFIQHYHYAEKRRKSEIMCSFYHSQKTFSVYFTPLHAEHCTESQNLYIFNIRYESIGRIIVDNSGESSISLLFHLLYPPATVSHTREGDQRSSALSQASEIQYNPETYERTLDFGCTCSKSKCSTKQIARTPILKLNMLDKYRVRHVIYRLSQRCGPKLEICYCRIHIHRLPSSPLQKSIMFLPLFDVKYAVENKLNFLSEEDSFSCQYAWRSMFSSSLVIRDHILMLEQDVPGTFSRILSQLLIYILQNVSALVQTFFQISDLVSRQTIFVFEGAVNNLFTVFDEVKPRDELPPGMCLARRVIITPSRIIYLPPSEHFDNRVIRKFGIEYMLRVSVQDDNFSKLTYSIQYHSDPKNFLESTVGTALRRGISVGQRHYQVLASSNSQLREHGLWFYAKDAQGNTAADVRKWLGDFSNIRNVAKYMSRMGQCFSSTEQGAQLAIPEEEEVKLEEIKNQLYTFTDGIGTISSSLAQEVRVVLQKYHGGDVCGYDPSAFQIRYRGCKGMVVEDPTLKNRQLGIRPSMRKFECSTSNHLEIVKTSAPCKLCLNRPLITILENLGIQSEVFVDLQKKMILSIVDSLIHEDSAAAALTYYLPSCFPYAKLQAAGISLIDEPFFRSLLLSTFKTSVEMLRSKARIAIPHEYGRNMLGVVDETKTLKYGQIFVQYSVDTDLVNSPLVVLEGTVLVTKNPCMHPGDVRKFQAIKVPALKHIKDCIVFPSQGKRPHPDEMAGSDLDGDEFVVIWLPELVFTRNNFPAMNYPIYDESNLCRKIEVNDMIEFFCHYIQNDNIGVFANAHLAWADQHPSGIFSKVCMEISKKYPFILDFAKTGTIIRLSKRERPPQYPDFMEKGSKSNSYYSVKSLGLLYRTTRHLKASVDNINTIPHSPSVDPSLVYPGWEKYEQWAKKHMMEYEAKMNQVLNRFGANSEAEAFCGCLPGQLHNQGRNEKLNVESLMKSYLTHIMQKYSTLFQMECDGISTSRADKKMCAYQKASAWYVVAYKSGTSKVLSFPWIVSDVLADVKIEYEKLQSRCAPNVKEYVMGNMSEHSLLEFSTEMVLRETFCVDYCPCVIVGRRVLKNWLVKIKLVNSGVTGNNSCSKCLDRICDYYFAHTVHSCCSIGSNGCTCSNSCSALKFIILLLKFYMNKVDYDLGTCTDDCNGFWATNLQSLALQTLVNLALTRNVKYLGIHSDSVYEYDTCLSDSEGDMVRIPVKTDEEKDFLASNMVEVIQYLKLYSGVRELYVESEQDTKNRWFLLINSVGRNFQRWHLEDLILDPHFIAKMQENLEGIQK